MFQMAAQPPPVGSKKKELLPPIFCMFSSIFIYWFIDQFQMTINFGVTNYQTIITILAFENPLPIPLQSWSDQHAQKNNNTSRSILISNFN